MKKNIINNILNKESYTIQVVYGYNGLGQAIFLYVLFNKKTFEELKNQTNYNNIEIQKKGLILLSGMGHLPSQDDEKAAMDIFRKEHLR